MEEERKSWVVNVQASGRCGVSAGDNQPKIHK